MKLLRFGLRIWITLASIASFLVGWIVLAHSPKPVQAKATSNVIGSLPTLTPLPPLNLNYPGQPLTLIEPTPTQASSYVAPEAPSFTTGGS